MTTTIRELTTEADRRSAEELAYEVYVREMNRFAELADHDAGRLRLENAERCRFVGAFDAEGSLLGCITFISGADGPPPDEYDTCYGLDRFEGIVPQERFLFGDNAIVRAEARGTAVSAQLFKEVIRRLFTDHDVIFMDCEPHLLNLYVKLGFRPYKRPFYEDGFGLMMPLLMFADPDHLRELRSPFASLDELPPEAPAFAAEVRRLCDAGYDIVRTQDTLEEWELGHLIESAQSSGRDVSIFSDLSKEEKEVCLANCTVLRFRKGDPLITQGSEGNRSLFLILEGSVEVRSRDDELIATRHRGEVLGEIGFMMGVGRSANVVIAEDGTRVLTFSQRSIDKMIHGSSETAAKFLLNLTRVLCLRLIQLT